MRVPIIVSHSLLSKLSNECETMNRIGHLRRSARKRPRLTPVDRLLWVWLSRIWGDWRSALAIVRPETALLAWCRFSAVLDLEGAARPTQTTYHCARGPRSDPQDVPGEPHLGCTPQEAEDRSSTSQLPTLRGSLPSVKSCTVVDLIENGLHKGRFCGDALAS